MAHLVFFEKPGCSGNARQKAMLIAAGHSLEVRDLLGTAWTAEDLRPYFGQSPVSEWFNPRAPEIRDGLLNPASLDEASALAAMIARPILIRRPLIRWKDECRSGFDPAAIDRWIGLGSAATLQRQEAERCQKDAAGVPCPVHESAR